MGVRGRTVSDSQKAARLTISVCMHTNVALVWWFHWIIDGALQVWLSRMGFKVTHTLAVTSQQSSLSTLANQGIVRLITAHCTTSASDSADPAGDLWFYHTFVLQCHFPEAADPERFQIGKRNPSFVRAMSYPITAQHFRQKVTEPFPRPTQHALRLTRTQ